MNSKIGMRLNHNQLNLVNKIKSKLDKQEQVKPKSHRRHYTKSASIRYIIDKYQQFTKSPYRMKKLKKQNKQHASIDKERTAVCGFVNRYESYLKNIADNINQIAYNANLNAYNNYNDNNIIRQNINTLNQTYSAIYQQLNVLTFIQSAYFNQTHKEAKQWK